MPEDYPFKWRHFEGEIILQRVGWYFRYSLYYRDLEERMLERGPAVDHSTICIWVQIYASELEKRYRPLLKPTKDSYRVHETYIKIKGQWKYLDRAVNSDSNAIDFMLSARRDAKAAKRFFKKALNASHGSSPRVILQHRQKTLSDYIRYWDYRATWRCLLRTQQDRMDLSANEDFSEGFMGVYKVGH